MKVVILAGGFGTRMAENCQYKPKPMVEIGGMPILWHIMKGYAYYGFDEFVICAGYLQQVIKEWFNSYFLRSSDITFDYRNGKNELIVHQNRCEAWKVTIVDTGVGTMTGGRIKRIRPYVEGESFMVTYGDGVSDVNIKKLLDYHLAQGKLATITAVSQKQQKGILNIEDGVVRGFYEKDRAFDSIINGGYMVMEPKVFDYIKDDSTVFESDVLSRLACEGELAAYKHDGFWQCMDSRLEMDRLEKLCAQNQAPWMIWK